MGSKSLGESHTWSISETFHSRTETHTADGRNPVNQLRLVVYPKIYRAFLYPRWCRISSRNSIEKKYQNQLACLRHGPLLKQNSWDGSKYSLTQSVGRSCNAKPMGFAMVWTLPEVDPPRKEHLFFRILSYVNVRLKRPENDLVGGFNPSEKYARQIGFIFPKFRGENRKIFELPPPSFRYFRLPMTIIRPTKNAAIRRPRTASQR